MNILIYNWCPLTSSEGGGVSSYCRNLITGLVDTEHQVFFLDSGFFFDKSDSMYIRESKDSVISGCRSFDLVNSPVIAPMKSPLKNIEAFVSDETLRPVLKRFVEEHEIDVLHFNNIEGLSIDCLNIKEDIPSLVTVYSLHNYTLFCPNVNLWTKEESNCYADRGYLDQRACAECMGCYLCPSVSTKKEFRSRKTKKGYELGRLQSHIFNRFSFFFRSQYSQKDSFELMREYRSRQIAAINRNIDYVLAVSEKVKSIAVSFGVDPTKISVDYIGTKIAQKQTGCARNNSSDVIRVTFLGYMKKEKGLEFLLDSIEAMDEADKQRIELTIAAKCTNLLLMRKIRHLKGELKKLSYFNGYTHEQLDEIFDNTDLGVVPVLWEDNMPQVAMEFLASGIPVLASSFGGASELSHNGDFSFQGGDANEFRQRLKLFLDEPESLKSYWDSAMHLATIEEHCRHLISSYYQAKS